MSGFDHLIDMLVGSEVFADELKRTASPHYTLKSENEVKSLWLFNVNKKIFCNIPVGSDVQIIDAADDESKYCMIGNSVYSVPNEILLYLGWN